MNCLINFTITQRNVNFVGEFSSRAHFKDDFMLIKNWIGTIPLKFLVFLLQGGGVIICRARRYEIFAPPYNTETRHFRGIVPIQFLFNIKLSLRWALDERFWLNLHSFAMPVAILNFGPWRQICTGYEPACRWTHWLNSGCFGPSTGPHSKSRNNGDAWWVPWHWGQCITY